MEFAEITPVVLTYNEEPNIARSLSRLRWAKDIVMVDSSSADRTVEIAKTFSNVRVFTRKFDSHERQWNFAISETGITTEWLLTLDADYVLRDDIKAEIASLRPEAGVNGYEAAFRYCVLGRPLPRAILPGRVVLFRRTRGSFYQDGHTQRLRLEGSVWPLRARIDHDDRKSLSQWIAAQDRYAQLERSKLLSSSSELAIPDYIRRYKIAAPILVLIYLLIVKRLAFAGFAGWYYTYQRVMAEIVLSLYLIEAVTQVTDASDEAP